MRNDIVNPVLWRFTLYKAWAIGQAHQFRHAILLCKRLEIVKEKI